MGSPRSATHWIGQLRAREPVAAQHLWEGCFRRLVVGLGDAHLRTIAVSKMEGYTTEEIAANLRGAPRTIESKLDLIRRGWTA
jgi:ECF sigma factor